VKSVGHGLFAGYRGDGNLVIDCFWPDESNPPERGVRVVVQHADLPDLLAVIRSDEHSRAIVGIGGPAATANATAAERVFWSEVFTSAMACSAIYEGVETQQTIADAATHADAALIEWRKRFA
jgi:hypothetical protein